MSAGKSHPDSQRPTFSRGQYWLSFAIGATIASAVLGGIAYIVWFRDVPPAVSDEATGKPVELDVPLVISRETTYITEPLTADGKRVDYFAAAERIMYPPEMATDDNGYRMVVQALGPSAENTPEDRLQIYEKLGLDPDIEPTLTYEDPFDVLTRAAHADGGSDASRLEMDLQQQVIEPWTLEDLPQMKDWLQQSGAALDVIAVAVRKPTFHAPSARPDIPVLPATYLHEVQRVRSSVRGFQARARFRMASGDVDGAIDDLVSCLRMGRHLRHRGFLIEDLVGVAAEAIAVSIGMGESLEHEPSEQQWQRLLDELDHLSPPSPVTEFYDLERLQMMSVIQAFAYGDSMDWGVSAGLWGQGIVNFMKRRDFPIDWNIVMRRANERYEQAVRGDSIPRPEPHEFEGSQSRDARSLLMGDLLTSLLIPAMRQYEEARRRAVCKENLLRIAIAMLLYEKQHGTLPPAYSVDNEGNPLHSWRVLILPYLGYDELYSQIRLDEPWDSAHNSQFHAADVPIYQCPTTLHSSGQTIYTVIEGDTTAFNGGEGKRLDVFGSNSANLILVAERIDAICWMDPMQEIPFAVAERGVNVEGATIGLGSEHLGGMHMALRSGAVRFFSEDTAADDLRGLLEGTIERAP
jgi:hypothetical protein